MNSRSCLVALVVVLAGCEFPRPTENAPDGGGGGPACKVDGDCATVAGKNVCDTGNTNVCVQCTLAKSSACTGTTPVCATDNACHGCIQHSDCPGSDTCLPDGSCAAEAAVVYLAPTGAPGACTKLAPCKKMVDAIAQTSVTRPTIKVSGTLMDGDGVISGGKKVTIVGAFEAVLKGTPGRTILDIRGAAEVAVSDVQITDADIAGITVSEGSKVELRRSKILRSRNEGLAILDGKATISKSEISNNGSATAKRGIALTTGELTVSQTKIAENGGGGVSVADNQKFTISNSFVVGNTGSGGISARKPGVGSKIEFNTIVDNQAGNGASDAGGIYCDLTGFVAPGNIIFRNTGGSVGSVQTFGICIYPLSFVAAGTGPTDATLAFRKDTAPRDYHLTAASPVTVHNVSGATCTGLTDYDDDARPLETLCDLGADEFKP